MPVSTDPDRSSATSTNGMRPRPGRPPAHRGSGSLRAGLHLRRRPLSRARARLAAQSGVPDHHGDLHHPLPAPVPIRAEGQPPLLEPHGRGSRPAAGPARKVMQRTCQRVEQCLARRQVPLCPPWPLPRPCRSGSRLNTSLPCDWSPNRLLYKPCEQRSTEIRSLSPRQRNVPDVVRDRTSWKTIILV